MTCSAAPDFGYSYHTQDIPTTLATATFVDKHEDHYFLDIDCPRACRPCAGLATSHWRRRAHLSRSMVPYTNPRSLQLHSEPHHHTLRLQTARLSICRGQFRQNVLLGVLQLAPAVQLRHFRCWKPLHRHWNVLAVPRRAIR
jgi:hypothetical protein